MLFNNQVINKCSGKLKKSTVSCFNNAWNICLLLQMSHGSSTESGANGTCWVLSVPWVFSSSPFTTLPSSSRRAKIIMSCSVTIQWLFWLSCSHTLNFENTESLLCQLGVLGEQPRYCGEVLMALQQWNQNPAKHECSLIWGKSDYRANRWNFHKYQFRTLSLFLSLWK